MKKNVDYDVIIIGAGPAGAAGAKVLRSSGLKAAVIEKHSLPRYKCCSGLLSSRAQELINDLFGNIPDNIICKNKWIDFCIGKSGYEFLDFPGHTSLHVYRSLFDDWLIANSGADILNSCFFVSYKHIENGTEVKIKKGREYRILSCRFLIDASGSNSKIRKSLDSSYSQNNLAFAYQELYKAESAIDKNRCHFLLSKKYSNIFAWVMCEDDNIFIGTCNTKGFDYSNGMNNLIGFMEDAYSMKRTSLIRKEGCFGDSRRKKDQFFFGKGNILLTGDSSSLFSYLGEGIPYAMYSGKYAAMAIQDSIKSGGPVNEIYEEYVSRETQIILEDWRAFGVEE